MEGSGNSWYLPRDRLPGFNVRRAVRAYPQVANATCPHCQREVSLSGFRQHIAMCRVEPHVFQEESGRALDPHTPSQIDSSDRDIESDDSEEFEDIGSDHLTIRSQFVSVNQSIDGQFAASLELPKKAPSRMSASRPQSGKKQSLSCPICFSEYDRYAHVPLVLPACGHTMCEHCMRRIYNSSSMAKCPVCRSATFDHVRTLPINYALLELNEAQRSTPLCKAHDKEVLAYCRDHELLLCGMCAFEHRDHQAFLLTSEEAAALVQTNKAKLNDIESRLLALQTQWKRAAEEQTAAIKATRELLDAHLQGIDTASDEACVLLKIGKNACVDELKSLVRESGIQDIQNECAAQMHKVTQDLQTLRERRTHFDQLTIAEKLATALSFRAENYSRPPSLSKIRELEEKMRKDVNYERAIRANELFQL